MDGRAWWAAIQGVDRSRARHVAFLHTNSKRSQREIKEIISFIIPSKRIKYLGINVPKEVKDLYSENYKTLVKETKDDTEGVFGWEESIL